MAKNSNTESDKPARVRRSPEDKAQSTLEQAQKRYDKAVAKRAKIAADIDAAEAEVTQAERFLVFAQGDPNLPPQVAAEGANVLDESRV